MADKPNLQQAIAEIGNMQRAYRAFGDASNAMAVLTNLDAVQRELTESVKALTAERDKLQADIKTAKDDAERMRQKGRETLATAEAKAAKLLAEAQAHADESVAAAQKSVASLNAKYAAMVSKASDSAKAVEAAERRLADLGPAVERAERIAAAVV
jgi:chromosome segregation ATPase